MRRVARALLVVAGAAATAAAQESGGAAPAVTLLDEAPVERELAAGEAHAYRLDLQPGDYARVEVAQPGIDVAVVLRRPSGEVVTEVDESRTGWDTRDEVVSLVAETPGPHLVEVRPGPFAAPPGRYGLRLTARRPATEADRHRVAGERALWAAIQEQLARKLQAAEPLARQAVEEFRRAGDRSREATALSYLGGFRHGLGDFEGSLRYRHEARAIFESLGDRAREAWILNLIATTHGRVGDQDAQLEYYARAREGFRAAGNTGGEAFMLLNTGALWHRHIGDQEKAMEAFEEALAVSRAGGQRELETSAHDWMGNVLRKTGRLEAARAEYVLARDMARAIGSRHQEGMAESRLGAVYSELGNYDLAVAHHARGLELAQASRGANRGGTDIELLVLRSFAEAYERLGDHENALKQARAAAAHAGEERSEVEKMRAIGARVEMSRGNLEAARAEIEAVLASVELRRALILRERARATLLDRNLPHYELYLEILMRLHEREPGAGHDAAALAAAERMRARGLVDLLAEAGVDLRAGADAALLQRERAALRALEAAGRATFAGRAGGQTEMAAALEEYEAARAEIRRASPRYAATREARHLGLAEIQALLDADTRLLSYALGRDRSYLWVVGPTSLQSFRLPARAEVERAALRLRESLARPPAARGRDGWRGPARVLSAMVLGPAAAALGVRRLLVVADGVLQGVPFTVLDAPGPSGARARPLVAEHEVVTLASATVLGALRAEAAARAPAPRMVAVLADPVFDREDPRVRRRATEATPPQAAPLSRALRDAGVRGPVPRLPFSRREAAAVTALAPAGQALSALDFAASRATATSDRLRDYRIVHFASHGLLDLENPELSGIVLSLVDEEGRPQDGFLRLAEVYGLRLRADLVVLSGCQTGLGRQFRGEGLVGLSRGFLNAGAARVVASLWKVDDRATAELMRRFYRAVLGAPALPPAAALREAQLAMAREERWAHPFHWAGFVLQGEWR